MFFRVFQHLLPRAEAWKVTIEKTLRRFFEGLAAGAPDAARTFVDQVYEDIFPPTTRELDAWEKQFGLEPRSDDATRRLALAAEWAATGGQSPDYIEGVLRTAGFDVYVHDWWSSGPPYVARDPRDHTEQPLIGTFQCSSFSNQPQCQFNLTIGQPQCNRFLANETYYLVNKDLTHNAPPPVPDDPAFWPFFMYVGGETFPDRANIPGSRRAEFERLILKLHPTHQWIVVLGDFWEEYLIVTATGDVDAESGRVIDYELALSAPATVTLPASPVRGDWIKVKAPSNATVMNVTVDGNGKLIDGAATFVLDSDDAFFAAHYNGTRWRVDT